MSDSSNEIVSTILIKRAIPNPHMMNEIELKVKGMSCAHCEMRVKKALETVDGVKKVKVDHKKGRAWVTFEKGSELDSKKLVDAVNATEVYEATV